MAPRISSLWIALCVVGGGCAVQRITAVEPIDSGTHDAANSAGDASIGGAADASNSGMDGSASSGEGSEGSTVSPGCTKPLFVTSDPGGIWSNAGYFVFNNMWNVDAGPGPQTLYACSYRSFYVVSHQMDSAGAVKTYPNVQKNFYGVPISSFHGITSTFAETSPHVGIYEYAYDVWLNGVATPGSAQIMIWVDTYNRVPTGSQVTTTTLGGHTYDVWKTTDNSYVALVSTVTFTSGTLNLLEIFDWTIAQGWLPSSSTLGQIDFGVEVVSTGAASATYLFNDFSIATN
jgi:hypothetical protein